MTLDGERTRCAMLTTALSLIVAIGLGGCGSGGNPFDNPSTVSNPSAAGGQKLSYAYFQRCVEPIFLTPLQINLNGTVATNTCAASGCHDYTSGTGGAFRIVPTAVAINVTDPANTPDVIRASDMYKNFSSAQGEVVIGMANDSRLLNKPLLRGILHGGGLVFASAQDPNAKLIDYWISHPAPQGQDEFSTATYNMFTPADPIAGTCNTN